MQADTGSLPSDTKDLTDDQLSFWSRRGFLLLKDFIGPGTLRELGAIRAGAGGLEARSRLTDCIRQLAGPVGALVDDEPELVRIGSSARTTAIGRDVWRASGKIVAQGVVATIALSPSNTSTREVVFYPQSHLIPAPQAVDGQADADMRRVAEEIRSRGLVLHTLSCRPGDVWLRHPMLVCGALASGRAVRPGAQDLEVVFCRREDLPTDRVRQGLAGVLGDRKIVAVHEPEEEASESLGHADAIAADSQQILRQTMTDGLTA